MNEFLVLLTFFGIVVTASAGGLSKPEMKAAVVEAKTASSGSDNRVGFVATPLGSGTAIAD